MVWRKTIDVEISSFETEKASYTRGQTINSSVKITNIVSINKWFVVVVSGTHKETGYPIVGTATVRLDRGESVSIPALIPIHPDADVGDYQLYADAYVLVDGKLGERLYSYGIPMEISVG